MSGGSFQVEGAARAEAQQCVLEELQVSLRDRVAEGSGRSGR